MSVVHHKKIYISSEFHHLEGHLLFVDPLRGEDQRAIGLVVSHQIVDEPLSPGAEGIAVVSHSWPGIHDPTHLPRVPVRGVRDSREPTPGAPGPSSRVGGIKKRPAHDGPATGGCGETN